MPGPHESHRPTVAVIGASRDRSKYGNISVRAHLQQSYDVYPVNPQADEIEGLRCWPSVSAVPVPALHRITIYLPPARTREVLDEIAALPNRPEQIWLNPGSADSTVRHRAEELGLDVIEACSIVDLGISPASV